MRNYWLANCLAVLAILIGQNAYAAFTNDPTDLIGETNTTVDFEDLGGIAGCVDSGQFPAGCGQPYLVIGLEMLRQV